MGRSVSSRVFCVNFVLARYLGTSLAVSLLCAALVCPSARADDDKTPGSPDKLSEARAHFQRGVQYYEESDYRAALLEFERAYAIQAAYQLLYNLGQVCAELKDYANAERYFRGYLKQGRSSIAPERRSEVLVELSRLRTRVGSLKIETNQPSAEIRVDDRLIKLPASGALRVSAGRREVVAEKQGYAPIRRSVDVLGGEEVTVSLEFAALNGHRASSDVLPWIAGAGSVALLLSAGAIGYWAYSDSSDYKTELNRVTTQDKLDRLHSQAKSKALISDVLLGTAIAGGIVTVILLVTDNAREEAAAPSAKSQQLTFDGRGIQLAF